MRIHPRIRLYGDTSFRGKCPSEKAEQITFVARVRKTPYGALLVHPRNEGKRTARQISTEKAEGLTTGAADIIIPGSPAFVCELKKRYGARLEPEQTQYLLLAQDAGAFVCVALGCDAAWEAYQDWLHTSMN